MVKQAKSGEANVSSGPATSFIVPPVFHSHSQEGTTSDTLQISIQFDRTHILYSNLPVAIIISVVLAQILVYVQLPVINNTILLGWLTFIIAVLLSRAVLFIAWQRNVRTDDKNDTHRWLQWFRISTIITGIVWGIGGLLLAPSGDIGHKIYVAFTLSGLCAGGSTTLAIDRISVVAFLLTILPPQIVFLAFEGDTISQGMSAMMALFLLFLLSSAWQLRSRLEENIHLRHKATESEMRFRQMLESSPIAARIVDAVSNEIVFANKSYISLIESSPEQIIGLTPLNYYAHPEEYTDSMAQVMRGASITNKLVEIRSPEDDAWTKWVLASYFAVEHQNKLAILGWFFDITDRKILEDKVAHMAYHDTLTGLPNRELFHDRLEQAIANAEREQTLLALLFVDLDKFKPVNDQHGHNIGDLLLIAVAERIRCCLRKTDSAARLGGDEFVILLPSIKSEENAFTIAETIRHALDQLFHINELTLNISSSIGIAIYPFHANDDHQLLKHADIAMYYAKSEGKNQVKVYNLSMQQHSN